MSKALRVALIFNGTVLHEQIAAPGDSITVGAGPRAAFAIPDATDAEHPLFSVHDRACTLWLLERMAGRVVQNGVERIVEGAQQLALGTADWGVLNAGPTSVFFQWVERDVASGARGGLARADLPAFNALVASLFMHLVVVVLAVSAVPPLTAELAARVPALNTRILAGLPPEPGADAPLDAPAADESAAARAAGQEGRFGAPEAPVEQTQLPSHDGPLVEQLQTPELGRAMSAAIGATGALSGVFGHSDVFSNNFGADFATAGQGDAFVLGNGSAGLGLRGPHRGGGGQQLGRAHGIQLADTGAGAPQGAALAERDEVRRATVTLGAVRADGGFLSREAIERVVRVHQRGIRYCYERELQSSPDLEGRITATWTIGLDGRVESSRITENTTNSRNVESCMLRELGRMRFPQPDGGLVVVSYPFTFRAAD